jgi:putative salt-induced outer membrane protein YdiY
MLWESMRQLTFLALILLVLCRVASADQIGLKNGDRLTGKIVKADGKTLVISTEYAGNVTVAWDAVVSVTSDAPLYVTLADGRTFSGSFVASNDRVAISTAEEGTVASGRAEVQALRSPEEYAEYERRLAPDWLELWDGAADFGFALATGNSETTTISSGLALSRTTARDKTSGYFTSLFASNREDDDTTLANIVRGGGRYEYNFSGRAFAYGTTELESNELQDLDLRLVLGGGFGYRAVRKERLALDVFGGSVWNREWFANDLERDSGEGQIGQSLTYKLTDRASLKQQFSFYPNLADAGAFRHTLDTTLVTSITRRIGWQMTVSNRYLSAPPTGLERNDLLLTTGLTYKIGRVGQ